MEAIEKRDPGGPVAGMTTASSSAAPAAPAPAACPALPPGQSIPPPPPEDALDPSFFDDNDTGHDIMNMDSVSSRLVSAVIYAF